MSWKDLPRDDKGHVLKKNQPDGMECPHEGGQSDKKESNLDEEDTNYEDDLEEVDESRISEALADNENNVSEDTTVEQYANEVANKLNCPVEQVLDVMSKEAGRKLQNDEKVFSLYENDLDEDRNWYPLDNKPPLSDKEKQELNEFTKELYKGTPAENSMNEEFNNLSNQIESLQKQQMDIKRQYNKTGDDSLVDKEREIGKQIDELKNKRFDSRHNQKSQDYVNSNYKIYEDKINDDISKVKTKEDAEYVSGLIDDNLEAGYISEEKADELYEKLDKVIDNNSKEDNQQEVKSDGEKNIDGSSFKNKKKLSNDEYINFYENHRGKGYSVEDDYDYVDGQKQDLKLFYKDGKHIATYNKATKELFTDEALNNQSKEDQLIDNFIANRSKENFNRLIESLSKKYKDPNVVNDKILSRLIEKHDSASSYPPSSPLNDNEEGELIGKLMDLDVENLNNPKGIRNIIGSDTKINQLNDSQLEDLIRIARIIKRNGYKRP